MLSSACKYLLLICIPVFSIFGPNLVGAGDAGQCPAPEVSLTFLEKKRYPNGQTSQTFVIHMPEKAVNAPTVLFRENKSPGVHKVLPVNNTVVVHAHQPTFIDLFVLVTEQDTIHVLNTSFAMYGKSRTPAERTPAGLSDIARLNRLPYIRLVDASNFYWHQTGKPLDFAIAAPDGVALLPEFWVRANSQVRPLEQDAADPSRFVYIPAHDACLRKAGLSAFRQDTVFTRYTRNNTRYCLSHVLQIHRSWRGYENQKAGGVVLAGSVLVFSGLVVYKRRKTPWWNE